MSEIKDRQDAASDIDPIVAALADDSSAAAAVEGVFDPIDTQAVTPDPTSDDVLAITTDTGETDDHEPLDLIDEPVDSETSAEIAAADDAATPAALDLVAASEAEPSGISEPTTAPESLAEPERAESTSAYADAVRYPEASDDVTPGSDDDHLLDDDLEHGIASVFAALHSAAQRAELGESDETPGPLGESEAIDGITFRLLGELDRLWHRAA